jgi:hypothetical protein
MSNKSTYVFSGHQTFVLRAHWLKRIYDVLIQKPTALTDDDAVVQLGVGKNMVDAMRYWAQMAAMIAPRPDGGWQPTTIAHLLLADDGIDPFVVTSWARWWLHWQLIKSPALTWSYLFMRMNTNEIDVDQVVRDIQNLVGSQNLKVPTVDVLRRDIQCVQRCYVGTGSDMTNEESLLCPLTPLGLMSQHDDHARLVSANRDDVPELLFVATVVDAMQKTARAVMPFDELMWGIHAPGRIFRMNEDALLNRLSRLEFLTGGAAQYSDHGGVRAVQWANVADVSVVDMALCDVMVGAQR